MLLTQPYNLFLLGKQLLEEKKPAERWDSKVRSRREVKLPTAGRASRTNTAGRRVRLIQRGLASSESQSKTSAPYA